MTFGKDSSVGWQLWKQHFLVFLFLLFVLYVTLLPMWQWVGIQPVLLLIILYHWTLYRPDLLSLEQLVLLSLIQDGIYAYPLGFSALRLLIDYALLAASRRMLGRQGFMWVWGGFVLFVMIDTVIFTSLLSCVQAQWRSILPLIPGMFMTISLYPLMVAFMNRFVVKRLSVEC
jgi:rod shape-determining protein MreD